MSGLDALAAIRAKDGPSVVMLTGMGSESVAVEAMRAGAIDYVVKDGCLPARRCRRSSSGPGAPTTSTRRAGELQRVALLVTSAADREAIFAGDHRGRPPAARRRDVRAVRRRARRAWPSAAASGGLPRDEAALLEAARRAVRTRRAGGPAGGRRPPLLVPLPSPRGRGARRARRPRPPRRTLSSTKRLDLARTFASFAGLALANLQQHELEQSLVAELQEMLDLRRELVASVSHELRTPLTCISGFAGTLDRLWDSLSEADRRRFVDRIRHHGAELTELVEGLLDFSAAEAGRLSAHCHRRRPEAGGGGRGRGGRPAPRRPSPRRRLRRAAR